MCSNPSPDVHLSPLAPDETQFRNCIVWLEDQKIRHYKIEDRGNLRNIPSSDWPKAYQKVRATGAPHSLRNTAPSEEHQIKADVNYSLNRSLVVAAVRGRWSS